jgi:hypothetical protein
MDPYGDTVGVLTQLTRLSPNGDRVGSLQRHTSIGPNGEIVAVAVRLDEGGSPDLYITRKVLNIRV